MAKVSKTDAEHQGYGPVESWHDEPGDAVYVRPGNLQRADAGTEYLQFSSAREMAEVEQQIMETMQAMQGAPSS